jgi:hypothetical protein
MKGGFTVTDERCDYSVFLGVVAMGLPKLNQRLLVAPDRRALPATGADNAISSVRMVEASVAEGAWLEFPNLMISVIAHWASSLAVT